MPLLAYRVKIGSWFIGFAPVENPKIAWAVVEGRGTARRASASIEGNLLAPTKSLGLLSEEAAQPKTTPARKRSGAAVSYQVFDIGAYRTPGLRNVALTAPCFHDSNVALRESGNASRSN